MTTFSTTRQLAAQPSAVFAAIRDPERLARWWGPNGFANRFEVFEFQPGGKWVFDMIGPDGTTYPNVSSFASIEDDRKVVIQHTSNPAVPAHHHLGAVDSGHAGSLGSDVCRRHCRTQCSPHRRACQ